MRSCVDRLFVHPVIIVAVLSLGVGVSAAGTKVKAKKMDVLAFRKSLSSLGDVFIFEGLCTCRLRGFMGTYLSCSITAFGASHRPHSSVSGISIPQRVCGRLMARELNYFGKVGFPAC